MTEPSHDASKVTAEPATKPTTERTVKPAPKASPLLTAPILPTLLKLAAPSVMAMLTSVLVGVAETYYVGQLGTTQLAAMALVFPLAMLTQMLSSGAMGGGVSSAISRALGAGDLPRAETLAKHALAIGSLLGVVYTAIFVLFGAPIFYALGGRGAVPDEAIRYGAVLFAGAWLIWLSNTLASILRGTGNMRVPSIGVIAMALLQIALGAALGLGIGPIPSYGLPGIATGALIASCCGVSFFGWVLLSGRARVRLRLHGWTLQRAMFVDILKVGAIACLSPLQSVLTALIITALVSQLGVAALAGYGIGQRLEFMLVPIAFGTGVASVPMVGMAIGAGLVDRARQVAWTAAGVSAAILAVIGVVVAVWPLVWAGVFSSNPEVLAHATLYLQLCGPGFPLFGLGLTLYFASQGSGKVLGPVLAGTLRLVVVAGVGYWLVDNQPSATAMFALVSAAMMIYGLASIAALKLTRWGS